MKANKEWSDKLKQIGLSDDEKDLDVLIPKKVKTQNKDWSLKVVKTIEDKTLVEFETQSGEMFPVAFVTENPADAKAMMILWLKENKLN